ncbi:hypothetical protein BH10ACT1_BH10ACT1_20360 [soil metagenome]
MRSPRRSRSLVLALAVVALASTSCGVAAGDTTDGPRPPVTTDPLDPPTAVLPTLGQLPKAIVGEAPAKVRSCVVDPSDPGQALVEVVVVNTSTGPKLMQGLPLTVRDGSGTVVSSDSEDLWSSIRIGAGRRMLLEESVDLESDASRITCELGEPDLRDDELPGGDQIDPVDLRLTSCSPTISVTVENTSDRPVSVAVVVEAFDAAGFSAGTFELGQRPTTYTDGTTPGPDETALPAGGTGTYEVDPSERISNFGTPLDGPVTSCQVLAARVVEDPVPTEVIVD